MAVRVRVATETWNDLYKVGGGEAGQWDIKTEGSQQ